MYFIWVFCNFLFLFFFVVFFFLLLIPPFNYIHAYTLPHQSLSMDNHQQLEQQKLRETKAIYHRAFLVPHESLDWECKQVRLSLQKSPNKKILFCQLSETKLTNVSKAMVKSLWSSISINLIFIKANGRSTGGILLIWDNLHLSVTIYIENSRYLLISFYLMYIAGGLRLFMDLLNARTGITCEIK